MESHATAIGFPDINYCCYGVENDLELKAGPDFEVRVTQKRWMEDRIKAGGYPLFLIKWGDLYTIVPGVWAADIRSNPSEENMLRRASSVWHGGINVVEFLKVLRNPKNEYAKNS